MKQVLCVEDDASLQAIYKDALAAKHIGYIPALNAREGLTAAKNSHPDLILLDIMLIGGQNGFDLLTTVKNDPATKSIPVIVVTNLDSEKQTALDLGAEDYVVKADISLDGIIEKVSTVLDL